MAKINHHGMEIYMEAFDEKDLLILMILLVLCICKLYDSLDQSLMIHVEFDFFLLLEVK